MHDKEWGKQGEGENTRRPFRFTYGGRRNNGSDSGERAWHAPHQAVF